MQRSARGAPAYKRAATLWRGDGGRVVTLEYKSKPQGSIESSIGMSFFPPPLAAALGAGGLVPFLALSAPVQSVLPFDTLLKPLRKLMGRPSLKATELQVTYGCCIMSFLGAPHWGWALSSAAAPAGVTAFRLIWGVTPALIAWPLASTPAPASLDALSAGLGLAYAVDAAAWVTRQTPRCYLALRTPLTLVAVLSLQSNREKFTRKDEES